MVRHQFMRLSFGTIAAVRRRSILLGCGVERERKGRVDEGGNGNLRGAHRASRGSRTACNIERTALAADCGERRGKASRTVRSRRADGLAATRSMGTAKRYYEAMMESGRIDPRPGVYVSAACFEDGALRSFIRKSITNQPCSYYCGRGKVPKGAPFDVVTQFIFEGLCSRYDDANQGVGWADDEYVGASTYDSLELCYDHLDLTEFARDGLIDDIAGALPDWTWSETDPYAARDHEVLAWSWDRFVDVVKHERRYFFEGTAPSDDEERIRPSELLAAVANKCRRARMIRKLKTGTAFYRCRYRKRGEHFKAPADLGPPPKDRASQSRMSPAGIPMFYGAVDEATARAETLASDKDRHTMALFGLGRDIHVLDLTQSLFMSIFDPRRQPLYDFAIFMRKFLGDLRKRVEKDDRVHIEYVPTQIVTEYFRTFLRTAKGKPIDGILYRSATDGGRDCIALFADAGDVAPALVRTVDSRSGHLLQMLSSREHG
ncbi:HEPN-associated N-terminal domain-containing protein [Sphingopyxis sp. 550A]